MSYGLVWFKRDFRLADHAALAAAAAIVERHGSRKRPDSRGARVQVDAAPAATQLDLGF
jgi:hypothetical protein